MTGCVSFRQSDDLKIDVMKICSENPKLVEKLIPFEKEDFRVTSNTDLNNEYEESWDLEHFVGKRAGLDWLQLTFRRDRLQTVWIGPRKGFETDMETLGLDLYFVKGLGGQNIEKYKGGIYQTTDLANRKVIIEHGGPAIKGTQVTCFGYGKN